MARQPWPICGQRLREAEREVGGRPKKNLSQPGTGIYALIGDHSLAKTTAYRWITMWFAPRMALGVLDHIWEIGELIEAAIGSKTPEPEGWRVGRFRVIEGGRDNV